MSGFFERLAAQARAPEGAILPRVPSRFEPVADSAGAEAPIETNAQAPAQRPRAKDLPAPHEPPKQRTETSRNPTSERNVSSKRDNEIPAAKAVSPVIEVRAESPATKHAQPEKRGREPSPEPVVALRTESLIEKRNETVRERIVERERHPSPIISLAPQEPAATAVQRRERVAERDSASPRAPDVRTIVRVETPILPIAPQVLPQLEPLPIAAHKSRPTPARQTAQSDSQAPAETVVHVSIGRVEVRAVTQPEERRRREPPRSPVMSLDDYLNARARQAR